MDPVTTAEVVTAVISSTGTVLAAWLQGRAQRQASHGGQQATGQDSSATTRNRSVPDRDSSDDRR
jgi:hypothetical protein